MTDETPIAYEAITKGTMVLSQAGTEIGFAEHVLADDSLDLFDGIVVKTPEGLRFVTADQVGLITTRAVHTKIADADIANLQKPHEGDKLFHDNPEEYDHNGLTAWFGRMFMREHWTRDKHGD